MDKTFSDYYAARAVEKYIQNKFPTWKLIASSTSFILLQSYEDPTVWPTIYLIKDDNSSQAISYWHVDVDKSSSQLSQEIIDSFNKALSEMFFDNIKEQKMIESSATTNQKPTRYIISIHFKSGKAVTYFVYEFTYKKVDGDLTYLEVVFSDDYKKKFLYIRLEEIVLVEYEEYKTS